MKRASAILISAFIATAGTVNAAEIYNKDGNKLNLYGKIDGLHYFSSDDSVDGDNTYGRFGLKGETQINQDFIGFGQWEYNVNVAGGEDDSSSNYARLAFAGLKHSTIGSIDYGRNYGILYDIAGWTDVLPEFGNDTYSVADNYMTSRTNGVATYRNTGFFGLIDGLDFAFQYQGKNDGQRCRESNGTQSCENLSINPRDVQYQNGDGWGVSTVYDMDYGFSFGAAFTSSNRTGEQKSAGENIAAGNRADAWTTGLKYDANNIYLAAMYSETINMTPYGNINGIANKTQNYELVAQYQFDSGFSPSLAYLQSKGKDLYTNNGQFGSSQYLVKYVDIGATQALNKNLSVYVDYKINLLDSSEFYKDNNISTDDILATGIVYQF